MPKLSKELGEEQLIVKNILSSEAVEVNMRKARAARQNAIKKLNEDENKGRVALFAKQFPSLTEKESTILYWYLKSASRGRF